MTDITIQNGWELEWVNADGLMQVGAGMGMDLNLSCTKPQEHQEAQSS